MTNLLHLKRNNEMKKNCPDCEYKTTKGIKVYKTLFCPLHEKDEIKIGDRIKIKWFMGDEPCCPVCLRIKTMDQDDYDYDLIVCENGHKFGYDEDGFHIRVSSLEDFKEDDFEWDVPETNALIIWKPSSYDEAQLTIEQIIDDQETLKLAREYLASRIPADKSTASSFQKGLMDILQETR